MKKFLQEFKDFANRGNLVDTAVGVIIAAAFNTVVNSLVADVFTPLITMIFGSEVDFSNLVLGQIQIGNFINNVISFIITAFCLFVIVKAINTAKKTKEEPVVEAAPEPSDEVKLLTEIRDLLAKNEK